jgi:hypothetical protein
VTGAVSLFEPAFEVERAGVAFQLEVDVVPVADIS